ncbi:alpha/beta hydrolase [Sandarakinorhabdus sp. AAP62]|uniref:alpha/beta fold hydrolase n=1 Tax=Sandarakinorhabdus sp. AAP62 TaxID=1248916 RepID=UPI00030A252B|nr:alpha/beta hydrolase [Sandarakinorhabdus sp. AAP62]
MQIMIHYGDPQFPNDVFVPHFYPEHLVDLGETRMNYAMAGPEDAPALLLVPGQTESWWGYEPAMRLLEDRFRLYAVDLRGQGRSSRTPGRYTIDNMGNDLVRFVQIVIGRPVIVCGLSSGGVQSAWLSAFAPPGLIRAALYEDPPLFGAEVRPSRGHNLHGSAVSLIFGAFAKYLGDQWSIGDWPGFVREVKTTMPAVLAARPYDPATPTQMLKEYDPEWARRTLDGTLFAGCDHARMLAQVKVPVLMTHHYRGIDTESGLFVGALSDEQADRVGELIRGTGQRYECQSFPAMGHMMHMQDPVLYAQVVSDWVATLD